MIAIYKPIINRNYERITNEQNLAWTQGSKVNDMNV